MNTQMKKDLENVINSVINEDTDKAISSFKAYLKEKTKEILETSSSKNVSEAWGEDLPGGYDSEDDYEQPDAYTPEERTQVIHKFVTKFIHFILNKFGITDPLEIKYLHSQMFNKVYAATDKLAKRERIFEYPNDEEDQFEFYDKLEKFIRNLMPEDNDY